MPSGGYTIDLWDLTRCKLKEFKKNNDNFFSFKSNVSLKIVKKKKIVKEENEVIVKVRFKASQEKDIAIYLFPIIKVENKFKGIDKLKKSDYLFLFLWELDLDKDTNLDKDTILIFSNGIGKYFSEYEKILKEEKKENIVKWKLFNDKESFNKMVKNITSSFYLFEKEEGSWEYKWKNILSFFPYFLSSALEDGNANAIYKLKWDSISFFKSRYMQEKTIKTWISERKQGENFIKSLFYGNLLKNLTVKICGKLLDLNGKGKGWFLVPTTKNDATYFNKVQEIVEKIKESKESENFPIFFYDQEVSFKNKKIAKGGDILKEETEELLNKAGPSLKFKFIDAFPTTFKEDREGNIFVINKLERDNWWAWDNWLEWNKKDKEPQEIITQRKWKFKDYKYELLYLKD